MSRNEFENLIDHYGNTIGGAIYF